MITLTEQQVAALDRLWEREQDLVADNKQWLLDNPGQELPPAWTALYWPSREAMNALVSPYGDSSGCVMIQRRGCWLGIETDGHTHS